MPQESIGESTETWDAAAAGASKILAGRRSILARLEGPVRNAEGAWLCDAVSRLTPSPVVFLDLRRADYVDSDGVRALLKLHGELAARSAEVRLVVAPGSRIARTLSLLKLQDRLPTFASALEAGFRRR